MNHKNIFLALAIALLSSSVIASNPKDPVSVSFIADAVPASDNAAKPVHTITTEFSKESGDAILSNFLQIITSIWNIAFNPKSFQTVAPQVGAIFNNIISIILAVFKKTHSIERDKELPERNHRTISSKEMAHNLITRIRRIRELTLATAESLPA